MAALTVRLEEQTMQALDRLAEQTDRPKNWLINRAVESYVRCHSWQVEQILAGKAEADRGEFASDEEVERVFREFDAAE